MELPKLDRLRAFEILNILYSEIGVKAPPMRIIADSPNQLKFLIKEHEEGRDISMYSERSPSEQGINVGRYKSNTMSFVTNSVEMQDMKHDGYINLLTNSCYDWFIGKDMMAICHFPCEIHKTEEGSLHFTDGMAIKFLDDTGFYFYRGVPYPSWWKEFPAIFTPEYISCINNGDKQSMAYDIYGWGNILNALKAKLINHDKDPEIGDLYHVQLPKTETLSALLKVKCGTGRTIVIPVSTTHRTAYAANIASYPDADYFPLEGRT